MNPVAKSAKKLTRYIRLKGRAERMEGKGGRDPPGGGRGPRGAGGYRKDVRFTLSNCSNKHANISR